MNRYVLPLLGLFLLLTAFFIPTTNAVAAASVTIPKGSTGAVFGGPITADGYVWLRVQWSNGAAGWVKQDSLAPITVTGKCVGTPPVPTYFAGEWISANANLNARSGAGTSYSIIVTIPSGSTGFISSTNSTSLDGDIWSQVTWSNGTIGWSTQDYLTPMPNTIPRGGHVIATADLTPLFSAPGTSATLSLNDGITDTPYPVAITSPIAGAIWGATSTKTVTWTSSNIPAGVNAHVWLENLSTGVGALTQLLGGGDVLYSAGSVTATLSSGLLKMLPAGLYDIAIMIVPTTPVIPIPPVRSAAFCVTAASVTPVPTVTITSPTSSSSWQATSTQTVTWTSTNVPAGTTANVWLESIVDGVKSLRQLLGSSVLYSAGTLKATLSSGLSKTLPAGTYDIKIVATTGSIPAVTSAAFQVIATTPAPTATVVSTYLIQHGLLVMNDNSDPGASLASGSIYTIRADGTGKKVLTGSGNQYPSWTPDGKIIFVSNRSGSTQIWIMDADGTNPKQIGNINLTGEISRVQMAKNGLIVFKGGGGIWLMQKDGSGLKQLVSFKDTGGDAPSLASSGTWLTYTAGTGSIPRHNEIFRINTDGTGLRQLTFPTDLNYPDGNASSISPDETTIAIYTGTESQPDDAEMTVSGVNKFATKYHNIGVMPAGGGSIKLLTACHPTMTLQEQQQMTQESAQNPGACVTSDNPIWSPDGKWIVYDRGSPNASAVGTWVIDINGNDMQRLNSQFSGGGSVPILKYVNVNTTLTFTVATSTTSNPTNSATVTTGDSYTLAWSSTNVKDKSCTLSSPFITGTLAITSNALGSSKDTITTAGTYTYSITCTGLDSTSVSKSVTITAVAPPPTVTLTVDKTSILSGQSATLTWSSTSADSCTSPDFIASATSSSVIVTPTKTITIYSITCTGSTAPAATATQAVTVTAPVPTVTITSPTSSSSWQATSTQTVTWTSTNVPSGTTANVWLESIVDGVKSLRQLLGSSVLYSAGT
ncbi:MAG: hypothetical protein Q7S26_03950, partial [bacterium]|nr:hypothetical protein [bacterium]